MKKPITNTILIATLLVALTATPLFPQFLILPTSITGQEFSGYEEMLPGVFVWYSWWNETSDDWLYPEDLEYPEIEPIWNVTVEDIYGVTYTISEVYEFTWEEDWDYSSLFVAILLDPDRSFVQFLTSNPTDDDAWDDYWEAEEVLYSGDEVFIYSSLYHLSWFVNYSFYTGFKWVAENGTIVDPNNVLLMPQYFWAQYLNESWADSGSWSYTGIGFDISEMFETALDVPIVPGFPAHQLTWIEHYYSGLTVFNDSNSNGLMDLNYLTVSEDFDDDDIPEIEFQVIDLSLSEMKYQFHPDNATIGEVVLPHVNENSEIEWGMEFLDINGTLISVESLYTEFEYGYLEHGSFWNDLVGVPTTLERLQFVCRFSVTDTSAVLKVDQLIGNFYTLGTFDILPEATGLSLAINYWSSFSAIEFIILDDEGEIEPEELTYADELEGDSLFFGDISDLFASINFGGTYIWGKDGQTYDVGTVITPLFAFLMPLNDESGPFALGTVGDIEWGYGTYYYSSCYANWSGYAITHDPIYTVHPAGPQLPINGTWALLPSIILLVIAVIALSVVIFRIRRVNV